MRVKEESEKASFKLNIQKPKIMATVIGRTDAEAEAPILWPPDVKN